MTARRWRAHCGDRFDSQARQSLRQSLLAIRKVLGERAEDVLTAVSDTVTLNSGAVAAGRFDRPLLDIFAVQDEITRDIAGAIGSEFVVAEEDRARRLTADNLNAWELLMRARGHYWRMTKQDMRKGRLPCEEAIERNLEDSRGYSLAALAHATEAYYGWSDSREWSVSEARRPSEKAISINPTMRALDMLKLALS